MCHNRLSAKVKLIVSHVPLQFVSSVEKQQMNLQSKWAAMLIFTEFCGEIRLTADLSGHRIIACDLTEEQADSRPRMGEHSSAAGEQFPSEEGWRLNQSC